MATAARDLPAAVAYAIELAALLPVIDPARAHGWRRKCWARVCTALSLLVQAGAAWHMGAGLAALPIGMGFAVLFAEGAMRTAERVQQAIVAALPAATAALVAIPNEPVPVILNVLLAVATAVLEFSEGPATPRKSIKREAP